MKSVVCWEQKGCRWTEPSLQLLCSSVTTLLVTNIPYFAAAKKKKLCCCGSSGIYYQLTLSVSSVFPSEHLVKSLLRTKYGFCEMFSNVPTQRTEPETRVKGPRGARSAEHSDSAVNYPHEPGNVINCPLNEDGWSDEEVNGEQSTDEALIKLIMFSYLITSAGERTPLHHL